MITLVSIWSWRCRAWFCMIWFYDIYSHRGQPICKTIHEPSGKYIPVEKKLTDVFFSLFYDFLGVLGPRQSLALPRQSLVVPRQSLWSPRTDHAGTTHPTRSILFFSHFFPLKSFGVAQAYFVPIETYILQAIMAHPVHLGNSRQHVPYSHYNHGDSSNTHITITVTLWDWHRVCNQITNCQIWGLEIAMFSVKPFSENRPVAALLSFPFKKWSHILKICMHPPGLRLGLGQWAGIRHFGWNLNGVAQNQLVVNMYEQDV